MVGWINVVVWLVQGTDSRRSTLSATAQLAGGRDRGECVVPPGPGPVLRITLCVQVCWRVPGPMCSLMHEAAGWRSRVEWTRNHSLACRASFQKQISSPVQQRCSQLKDIVIHNSCSALYPQDLWTKHLQYIGSHTMVSGCKYSLLTSMTLNFAQRICEEN